MRWLLVFMLSIPPAESRADQSSRPRRLGDVLDSARELPVPVIQQVAVSNPCVGRAARPCPGGLLPELRSRVPSALYVSKSNGRTQLRFTAGIANVGQGPLVLTTQLKGNKLINSILGASRQLAFQQILDARNKVTAEIEVGEFDFHKEHEHVHVEAMTLYELRKDGQNGSHQGRSRKVSFCLTNTHSVESGAARPGNPFGRDCQYKQGVSPGWMDVYDGSLPGQQFDITDLPDGRYYIVVRVNPEGKLVEQDALNNTAWQGFDLRRTNSEVKIELRDRSECSAGLCGFPPKPAAVLPGDRPSRTPDGDFIIDRNQRQ